MAKQKRNLSVSDDVDQLLDRVGNASEYVDRVVRARWREWTEALDLLVQSGWVRAEILAACDALNGYWMIGSGKSGAFIAAELEDAERLNKLCAKWDLAPERWAQCYGEIGRSQPLAHALTIVVEEFWTGNEAIEAAIAKAGRRS